MFPYDATIPRSIWCPHKLYLFTPLRWRHNDHAGVSNHQPHGCLLNRLFRLKSKITSKLRVTGLCAGNSPGTGEFPAQMASYAENVSIWWRHHALADLRGLDTVGRFHSIYLLSDVSYHPKTVTPSESRHYLYRVTSHWLRSFSCLILQLSQNIFPFPWNQEQNFRKIRILSRE